MGEESPVSLAILPVFHQPARQDTSPVGKECGAGFDENSMWAFEWRCDAVMAEVSPVPWI